MQFTADGSDKRAPRSKQRTSKSNSSSRSVSGGDKKKADKKQVTAHVETTSQKEKGGPPASAPQAVGEEQAKEPVTTPAPSEAQMEEPSAQAHQAAEGGQASGSATGGKEFDDPSFLSPTKEGTGTSQPCSTLASPALSVAERTERIEKIGQTDFNFSKTHQPRKPKKPWGSRPPPNPRKPTELVVTQNRFNPLSPFEDPEGMDH